jgi:hypothetical protein
LAPAITPKQALIIDAAVEAGVSRFIPSEFGFDLTTPYNSIQPAYKGKVAIQHQLQKVASGNPDFSYTLISNGTISIGIRLTAGGFADFIFQVPAPVFEIFPKEKRANIIGDGDAPISFTSYQE